eukprot:gene24247-9843_t
MIYALVATTAAGLVFAARSQLSTFGRSLSIASTLEGTAQGTWEEAATRWFQVEEESADMSLDTPPNNTQTADMLCLEAPDAEEQSGEPNFPLMPLPTRRRCCQEFPRGAWCGNDPI